MLSVGLYVLSIGLAMWQPKLAVVPFVAVAVLWLVADPRIERYIAAHDDDGSR